MWLKQDLDEMLAWQAELDTLCNGCGRPKDEAWHPDAEGTYEARVSRCHACAEQAHRAAEWGEQSGADKGGIYIAVQPTNETPKGMSA